MTMGYQTWQSTNMCALDIPLWVNLTDANGNSTELEIDPACACGSPLPVSL